VGKKIGQIRESIGKEKSIGKENEFGKKERDKFNFIQVTIFLTNFSANNY